MPSAGIHLNASSTNAWPSCETTTDFFAVLLTCFGGRCAAPKQKEKKEGRALKIV